MADYEYYDTLDSFSEINFHETERINFCGYALSKGAKKSNINGKEVDAIDVMGEHFARLMASYSVSNSAEYRDQDELTEDALDAVEEKKEEIMKSTVYREMFQQKNKDAVLEMIFGAKQLDDMKNGVKKDLPEMLPPDRLAENFAGKLRQQEATEKTQKDILKELKTTTSKSLTGKIKSFFVGNSKEYDNAMKALEGATNGTMSKEDAALQVMAYLDIRKDKVRDHEYGRDRFDGMMRGLRTLMKPEQFKAYCLSVDDSRKQRDPNYKGVTNPEDYMSPEERAQEREKAAKAKEAQQDKLDAERIAKDAQDPERAAKNEKFLNWLKADMRRNMSPKERLNAEEYVTNHPGVREQAQKISEARGLDLDVPKPPKPELVNAVKPAAPKTDGPDL